MAEGMEFEFSPEITAEALSRINAEVKEALAEAAKEGLKKAGAGIADVLPVSLGEKIFGSGMQKNFDSINKMLGGKGGTGAGILGAVLGGGGSIGGAIGGMIEGPVGAIATEMIDTIATGLKTAAKAPFQAAAQVLAGDLGGALSTTLKGAIGALVPMLDKALGGMLSQAADAIGGFVNSAIQLASKANPVTAEQFQRVFADMQATVGRVFAPMLEKLTMIFRALADVLFTILPSQAEMRNIFDQLDPLIKDFRNILADLAPVLQLIIQSHLRALVTYLHLVEPALRMMAMALHTIFAALGKGGSLQSSLGAAGGHAGFSSIEEYGRQATLAAARGPRDKTAEMPNKVFDIASAVKDIRDFLLKGKETIGNIQDAARNPAGTAAGIVGGVARGLGHTLGLIG